MTIATGNLRFPRKGQYPRPGLYPGPADGSSVVSRPKIGHEWSAFTRTAGRELGVALPIVSVKGVRRHLGVDTAILVTTFTPDRWAAAARAAGIIVNRDGRQQFAGQIAARQLDWDAAAGTALITLEANGDLQYLADRLVMPDPTRRADDQTVNDYWTFTGVASTAMRRLISDQAGPTCYPDRRVAGLVLGSDPGVGINRKWTGLFDGAGPRGVLDQLVVMSVASGANLGVRATSTTSGLRFDIYQPRDLTGAVKFSADMNNLVGFSYREAAPTATDGIAAGQGNLHARIRKVVTTTSAIALSWGRRIFAYIDRRDTADTTELTTAAADAVTQGDSTISLTMTLLDNQATTYQVDWDLGDKATVFVGLPGQVKVAELADVIREIYFEVDSAGAEGIRPAIGSYDATTAVPTATQKQLAAVGSRLAGLISRT